MTTEPTTDVAVHTPMPAVTVFNADLNRELIELAKMVAPGSLLPNTYRDQPANLLICFNLGVELGISPMQAVYDIYVVNGRPSMSANLMGALVRKSGHKLHVKGDDQSCTATLTRWDDRDNPFEFTWTIDMAKRAMLTGKDTWKYYPATMLRCRAISEVCKAGAAECLKGITLSTEEARDMVVEGEVVPARKGGLDAVRAAVAPARVEEPAVDAVVVDAVTGEILEPAPVVELLTADQRKAIAAGWGGAGINSNPGAREGIGERVAYIRNVVGRDVSKVGELTAVEAAAVIAAQDSDAAALSGGGDPDDEEGQ